MDDKDSSRKPLSDVGTDKSFETCPTSAESSTESHSTIRQINTPVPSRHSDSGVPHVEPGTGDAPFDQDRAGRKLLTVRRKILVKIKSLLVDLKSCKSYHKFSEHMSACIDLRLAYSEYQDALAKITDPEWLCELNDQVDANFNQYMDLFNEFEREYTVVSSEANANKSDIEPADSVSQVSGSISALSKVSNKSNIRRIELDKRRAELKISHDLQKAKLQARTKAKAEEARVKAEEARAKAEEARAKVEEEQAEALAKIRLQEAALEAEEKLLACSELGSTVTSLRSSKTRRSKPSPTWSKSKNLKSRLSVCNSPTEPKIVGGVNAQSGAEIKSSNKNSHTPLRCAQALVESTTHALEPTVEKQCRYSLNPTAKEFVRNRVFPANTDTLFDQGNITAAPVETYVVPTPSICESAMKTYLDRQGRNEYINLASQIAYDGKSMAFVFFENQIRRLMDESPYPDRRFEVLRASCVGQPREMVNLFFAPMRAMSTSQRVEKALARLKERYGVPGGLTSEPKVMEIRYGPKITFNTASLKAFNEELNLMEVFAYAHDEVNKLSGQLLLDTANRLPNFLKRRYLDYLTKIGADLNRPGFDALREFVKHELSVSTSDYAQTFFGSDDKEKSRDTASGGRRNNQVRVRQVFLSEAQQHAGAAKTRPDQTKEDFKKTHANTSVPPICFVCNDSKIRHFLADCEMFKSFSPLKKRRAIGDANRCLNCLSRGHIVKDCKQSSKCRQCAPTCSKKHAAALHDWYILSPGVSVGGAESGKQSTPNGVPPSSGERNKENNSAEVQVRKISDRSSASEGVVLLRTSAVRVINPATGKSTLAYAQHDTASQATLVSERLRNELDLETICDSSVSIKTLSDQTAITTGRTNFNLESLSTGEDFFVKNALIVPNFCDDESVLPHSVDVAGLENFSNVEIPTIPERRSIDVLIGQADKNLLTVLSECENIDPDKPNFILTRLGPIASGGRVPAISNLYTSLKVNVKDNGGCAEECCVKLKAEIAHLKQSLRELTLEDEAVQPSRSDEVAKDIVETDIKLIDHRYEIPVPLNVEVVEKLPNNYQSALDRARSMRRSALKNPELQITLTNTFGELIDENWISPVEKDSTSSPMWYLPYFVTKQKKPRVVYDGAALHKGMCLNQAVLGGTNLLNNLVEVLTRFRLGRYACIADLSKCFFQVSIPRKQRDLFRIIWFKNNDVVSGEIQTFCFTRHVWGINSSPYVALTAINTVVSENPTGASSMTLNAIENNRYMDDMLLACDTLSDLEIIAGESRELFSSRGFTLRKWIANSAAASILTNIPRVDLAGDIKEVDLGSQPLPNSKALGLIWDPESDRLRIKSTDVQTDTGTRRKLSSKLASLFDPLGLAAPYLLAGKLILQEVATLGFGWDDELPDDILRRWDVWVNTLKILSNLSLPRCCCPIESNDNDGPPVYQLHGFCDASNSAMSAVIYLRRIVKGEALVSFLMAKCRLVLNNQSSWVISRKELEAAKICSELMLLAARALHHLPLTIHFWTDSQVVLKWIINPDLHLVRFVKRRIDKILLAASPESWRYVHTSNNPADVGTREGAIKRSEAVDLWLHGPAFLQAGEVQPLSPDHSITVRSLTVSENELSIRNKKGLDRLVEGSPNLYILKKRAAYLTAFKEYFILVKVKKERFEKPVLDATYLEKAFFCLVRYVQDSRFGSAVKFLKDNSPDKFDTLLKRLDAQASHVKEMHHVNELKTLRKLRPCVGTDLMLRVEGRLENAALPVDAKHPIILPGRHALTRLIALHEHVNAGHAGPSYTLMLTRQKFWIIHGISSVKRYLVDCGKCALAKAKPIRQLMSDLPTFRVTAANKPFKFCGTDYFGPFLYKQNRSLCKAWGILFTCLCTRCVHVEIVTSMDLNNFILAFSRFTNLRGPVDTFFSDNGKTFCAAEKQLPQIIDSTEFHNSLRHRGINWVRIPPYAASQAGTWESMVKLIKRAMVQVMSEARRKPSLIELQTFVSDAIRIVNDRPLTTLSDKPNDLKPLTPSCFLGQHLAPNTPVSAFHEKGDLRNDYLYNAALAQKFWTSWMKSYLPTLQGRSKWRELRENLSVGQLVLVGDAEDLSKRGAYRLGRVHCVHPQVRKGREIVRRATIGVLSKDPDSGKTEIKYVMRDLSKIAPV